MLGFKSSDDQEAWQRRVQPTFLKNQGLRPDHNFLDLGCCFLRGTVDLVDYLEEGRFYGIDVSSANIRKAKERVSRQCHNRPNLAAGSLLGISKIWPTVKFDFILAASVFTHLLPTEIEESLREVGRVLGDKGKFFATILKDNTVSKYDGWCGSCADHRFEIHRSSTFFSRWKNYLFLDLCHNSLWISEKAKECNLVVREIGASDIYQFMLEIKHNDR